MKIQEFEALTLKECLHQVRQELGPEAVILETKKFRRGGVMGWGSHDAVKIVAATGIAVTEPRVKAAAPAAVTHQSPKAHEGVKRPTPTEARISAEETVEARPGANESYLAEVRQGRREAATQMVNAATGSTSDEIVLRRKIGRLESEILQLREGMDSIREAVVSAPLRAAVEATAPAAPSSVSPRLQKHAAEKQQHTAVTARLLDAGISPSLTEELVARLPSLAQWSEEAGAPVVEKALRELISGRISVSGPIALTPGRTKIVTLVGPTGVGKTTTIAKLAAHYALVEKKRVGLLTMDTYRIAAVEQLKTYSQIMNIPIKVAYSHAEILPALKELGDVDLVLIDTAGRSQKNAMQVRELKTLTEATGCETHLVLSASTRERDLLDQVERFRTVGVDRLLFTKMDETSTYGTLVTIAAKTAVPLSYLTTGQKVPEDIEVAESEAIAGYVLDAAKG